MQWKKWEQPVEVSLSGQATAVGEDTEATGKIDLYMVDKGPVTLAFGKAKFTATATSSDGSGAFASADTDGDTSGFDVSLSLTMQASDFGESDGTSYATALSSTRLFGLNIEAIDRDLADVDILLTFDQDARELDIEGNTAFGEINALVRGDNTSIQAFLDQLAVEDSLSLVAVDVYGLLA